MLRERAARLIYEFWESDDAERRVAAVLVLKSFSHGVHSQESESAPLAEAMRALIEELSARIAKRTLDETDVRVLRAVESVMRFRWLARDWGGDAALASLKVLPKTVERFAFTLAFDREVVLDYDALADTVHGQEEPWRWWVHAADEYAEAASEHVAELLSERFESAAQLAAWLRDLFALEDDQRGTLRPRWLVRLAQRRFELIDRLYRNRELRESLPAAVRAGVRDIWVRLASDSLEWVVGELPTPLSDATPDEVWTLLSALAAAAGRITADELMRWMLELARHPDVGVRKSIVDALASWSALLLPNQRVQVLAAALEAGADRALIHAVHSAVRYADSEVRDAADRAPLRRVLRDVFNTPDLWLSDDDGWIFSWSLHGQLDGFFDWMEERLDNHQHGDRVSAIDGWDHLREFVASAEEVGRVMSRLERWRREGKLREDEHRSLSAALGKSAPRNAILEWLGSQVAEPAELPLQSISYLLLGVPFDSVGQLWLKLLRAAEPTDDAAQLFGTFDEAAAEMGLVESRMGEVSPQYATRLATLKQLGQTVERDAPAIRRLVERAIARMKKTIAEEERSVDGE